jgi:ABC-type molybdate transport system substrate-binding protein
MRLLVTLIRFGLIGLLRLALPAADITVFAAASLSTALREVGA